MLHIGKYVHSCRKIYTNNISLLGFYKSGLCCVANSYFSKIRIMDILENDELFEHRRLRVGHIHNR